MPVKGRVGNFRERVTAEAKAEGVELTDVKSEVDAAEEDGFTSGPEPNGRKQAALPGVEMTPLPTVIGKKINCKYVRPHYTESKDGRVLEMEFSFPLTTDHKGLIPESVEDAWNYLVKSKSDTGQFRNIDGIDPVAFKMFIVPEDKTPEFVIETAEVVKAALAIVEESGSGKLKKVYRFSFRVVAELGASDATIRRFADHKFGDLVWVEMAEKQMKLK